MTPALRPGRWVMGILMLAACLALPAAAQEVPAIDPGAPEGAEATARIVRPFDRYALPVGPYGPEGQNALMLQGEVVLSAYLLDDPDASTADVIEGYRSRLAELGFEPVFDCTTTACGGFDFRFAVTLLPAPAMLMDTADFAQLSMRLPPEGGEDTAADGGPGEIFASVLTSRVLGAVYIQTAIIVPKPGELEITTSPGVAAAPENLILPQDEKSLFDRLMAQGHVPVQGLVFETGGTRLSEGSAEALDMLARLLTRNADISVAIVGHSDNQGALEPNIELSRQRAAAVREALIDRGVAEGKMEAYGAGWLAPIAANDSEAGRALNRRVELVLR